MITNLIKWFLFLYTSQKLCFGKRNVQPFLPLIMLKWFCRKSLILSIVSKSYISFLNYVTKYFLTFFFHSILSTFQLASNLVSCITTFFFLCWVEYYFICNWVYLIFIIRKSMYFAILSTFCIIIISII